MPSARNHPSPRWPFWLLLGAWLCANTPAGAVGVFLTWFSEARTFSHQHRLTAQVAMVLVGEKKAPEVAPAADPSPANPMPAVAVEGAWKMIPLSLERAAEVPPPSLKLESRLRDEAGKLAWLRPPPAHGPPRLPGIA